VLVDDDLPDGEGGVFLGDILGQQRQRDEQGEGGGLHGILLRR
jgi:hypothetical protein